MKKPFFSIICPFFNSELSLESAVLSVVNQRFKDYELILVDDGSTDKSHFLADEFKKKYLNIIVIHKSNEGQAKARLDGIRSSNGDYLLFLDSDDEYEDGALEFLANNLTDSNIDFLVYNATKHFDDNNIKLVYEIDNNSYESPLVECLCKRRVSYFWTICFKKELLKRIDLSVLNRFTTFRYSEDFFLIYNLVKLLNNNFKFINDSLYCYKSNEHSITNNQDAKKLMDRFYVFNYVYEDFCKNYPNLFKEIIDEEKTIIGWTGLSAARRIAIEYDNENYLANIITIRNSFLFKRFSNFKKDKYNKVGYILLKLKMYSAFKKYIVRNEGIKK